MKSMNDTRRQHNVRCSSAFLLVKYAIAIAIASPYKQSKTNNCSFHSSAWAVCGNLVKKEKNNYLTPPYPLSLPTLPFSTPVTQAESSNRELKLISCTVCSVHFSTWSLSFERQQKQTLNNARSWCCIWQVRYCDIGKSKVSFFT